MVTPCAGTELKAMSEHHDVRFSYPLPKGWGAFLFV
jgi:hypothetical protein